MSEDGCSGLDSCSSLDTLSHGCAVSDTLGIDDDVVLLSSLTSLDDTIDDSLLISIVTLRNKDLLGTVCHTAPHSDISGSSAHNLDDRTTLMGSRSISELIDSFHCCIDGCIKTDGIICTSDIKVDGSGTAYGVNAES